MTQDTLFGRQAGLDVLRGFAILAMLAVNIQLYASVWIVADIPNLQPGFANWGNQAVWLLTQTIFSQSGLTLFAVLFGAALSLGSARPQGRPAGHWRRLTGILVIGLLHAYLFWYGDVLVAFALVAMIVAAAHGMTVRGQVSLGLGLIAFTGLMLLAGSAMGGLIGNLTDAASAMGFNPDSMGEIEALYREGFIARLSYNMSLAVQSELMQMVFMSGRLAGCMLLGMAAVRTGFLTLEWPARRYGVIAATGIIAGLLLCGTGAWHALATDFTPAAVLQNRVTQYFGSLALALGYGSALLTLCKLDLAGMVQDILAAVGRMALSNYLAQTLVMTLLFTGFPGLGQFGQIDQMGQALLVLTVWVAQAFASVFWLQRYRHGPVEWLLRAVSDGHPPRWRL